MRETEPRRNECREDTIASHRRAVERVITSARERLCGPSRCETCRASRISARSILIGVFHQITGLPPAKFISAMRLDEAKRLLLNTDRSITDISFEVGYNSLSTFTRRFTQRVGLGPVSFGILLNGSGPRRSSRFARTTRS